MQTQNPKTRTNATQQKMSSDGLNCCPIDQSDRECVDLSYDDSHCGKLHQCCGGIHDAGLQRQCNQRVRECRKLGNAWDAARPLRPMDVATLYTDVPGYSTQGQLVTENFSGSLGGLRWQCVLRSAVMGILLGLIIKSVVKTDISMERIVCISVAASLLRCMSAAL